MSISHSPAGTTPPTGTSPASTGDAWHADAACADEDPELFFDGSDEAQQRAMRLCAGCPVRTTCLRIALELGEMHGIWGGTTEAERRRMIRHRRREQRRRSSAA